MEWLEASLAFAVTMMVFSTMVSVIVESCHRLFRLREDGLRRIVEELVPTFNDYQARIDSSSAEKPSMTDLSNLFGMWEKRLLGILNQHTKNKKKRYPPGTQEGCR